MKPAWDELAEAFAGADSKVVVADVDCTAEGEPLCERFGIEGFPTIKYFNPPDEDGEDYAGDRDLESLKEFAAGLGPGCAATTREHCSAEQLSELEGVLATPEAERQAELDAIVQKLADQEAAHERLLESLQAQYEQSNTALEAAKKEVAPRVRLLKASGVKASAATAGVAEETKDEM
jgi:hypothetical protein